MVESFSSMETCDDACHAGCACLLVMSHEVDVSCLRVTHVHNSWKMGCSCNGALHMQVSHGPIETLLHVGPMIVKLSHHLPCDCLRVYDESLETHGTYCSPYEYCVHEVTLVQDTMCVKSLANVLSSIPHGCSSVLMTHFNHSQCDFMWTRRSWLLIGS